MTRRRPRPDFTSRDIPGMEGELLPSYLASIPLFSDEELKEVVARIRRGKLELARFDKVNSFGNKGQGRPGSKRKGASLSDSAIDLSEFDLTLDQVRVRQEHMTQPDSAQISPLDIGVVQDGMQAAVELAEGFMRFGALKARQTMGISSLKKNASDAEIKRHFRASVVGDLRRLRNSNVGYAERLGAAYVGLFRAANRFDPSLADDASKPADGDLAKRFMNLASYSIETEIVRLLTQSHDTDVYYPRDTPLLRQRAQQVIERHPDLSRGRFGMEFLASSIGSSVEIASNLHRNRVDVDPFEVDPRVYDRLAGYLEDDESFDDNVRQDALAKQMKWVLETLAEREAETVELRSKEKKFDEISNVFGVTRERVRQIELKAMSKLSHPSRSDTLRDFLLSRGSKNPPRPPIKRTLDIFNRPDLYAHHPGLEEALRAERGLPSSESQPTASNGTETDQSEAEADQSINDSATDALIDETDKPGESTHHRAVSRLVATTAGLALAIIEGEAVSVHSESPQTALIRAFSEVKNSGAGRAEHRVLLSSLRDEPGIAALFLNLRKVSGYGGFIDTLRAASPTGEIVAKELIAAEENFQQAHELVHRLLDSEGPNDIAFGNAIARCSLLEPYVAALLSINEPYGDRGLQAILYRRPDVVHALRGFPEIAKALRPGRRPQPQRLYNDVVTIDGSEEVGDLWELGLALQESGGSVREARRSIPRGVIADKSLVGDAATGDAVNKALMLESVLTTLPNDIMPDAEAAEVGVLPELVLDKALMAELAGEYLTNPFLAPGEDPRQRQSQAQMRRQIVASPFVVPAVTTPPVDAPPANESTPPESLFAGLGIADPSSRVPDQAAPLKPQTAKPASLKPASPKPRSSRQAAPMPGTSSPSQPRPTQAATAPTGEGERTARKTTPKSRSSQAGTGLGTARQRREVDEIVREAEERGLGSLGKYRGRFVSPDRRGSVPRSGERVAYVAALDTLRCVIYVAAKGKWERKELPPAVLGAVVGNMTILPGDRMEFAGSEPPPFSPAAVGVALAEKHQISIGDVWMTSESQTDAPAERGRGDGTSGVTM